MPQSFADVIIHIIFSTGQREASIDPEMRTRLYEYFGGILRSEGCRLLAAGGMPDHVHLLISLSRERTISNVVRLVKANSSRWIHDTFSNQGGFAWQTGYGAFSVSHSNIPAVKDYIDSQAEHHRATSFKDEFLAFLKRHEIPYDERYIWA